MTIEVDLQGLRDMTDNLLFRVEDGETIVITQMGKPIAELIPHREETVHSLTSDES
jgi:prevent-host-death family protein